MAKNIKLSLNRRAFQSEILYNERLGEVCASKFSQGGDAPVIQKSSNREGKGRIRARVYGNISDEQARGSLSRRLGG